MERLPHVLSITIIDDTLVFTSEGLNRPRKVTTGNSSDIASSAAPYCKSIIAYLGFLFAINISDSGAFTDVFDGHRTGRYADDWDTAAAWSPCDLNEIVLDETPGPWVNSVVIGRNMFALKSDGVIGVRWIGGQQKFQQDGIKADVGIVAPLSLGIVGSDPGCAPAAFFLGTDGIIYQISEQGVKAVSYDNLSDLIPNTSSLAKLKYARGLVDSEDDTYYLFYDRTGLSNMLLDSYVSFNYRTGEWSKGTLHNLLLAQHSRTQIKLPNPFYYPLPRLSITLMTLPKTMMEPQLADIGLLVGRRWLKKGGCIEYGLFLRGRIMRKLLYLLLRSLEKSLAMSRSFGSVVIELLKQTWKWFSTSHRLI